MSIEPKRFSDLGIKPSTKGFTGDKIKMERVLNKEISVCDYRIEDSTKKEGTKCLHLQIKVGDTMNVIFTGSKALMEQIEQVPKQAFPFITTIIKENDRFEFT